MKKFQLKDIVVPSNRCPKWLLALIKCSRKRTVIALYYDRTQQHTLYFLGSNRMGYSDEISNYPFRAEQLEHYILEPTGRPSKKQIRKMRGIKSMVNGRLLRTL